MPADYVGIAGWLKNSFIDFPGTVSTVLFFSGCNLRCPYCHNPDLVRSDGRGTVDHHEVLSFLEKRKGLIDGVVVSGGEPTLHSCLPELVSTYKNMGYRVKLDTNGLLPERITAIAPDYLALDIKTLPENYPALAQASFTDVEERLVRSLDIVRTMGERAEVRITVAPDFVGKDTAMALGPMLTGVQKIYLQPIQKNVTVLNPDYDLNSSVGEDELQDYRSILSEFVDRCEIRGSLQ